MENFKGTKGQWNADTISEMNVPDSYGEFGFNKGFFSKTANIKDQSGRVLADVKGFDTELFVPSNDVAANALLISKAPELLEMLNRIVEDHLNDRLSWATLVEAKSLIKSATELNP